MKTFEYKGFTVSGAKTRGMIEAVHAKSAKEILAKDGILVEHIAESGNRRVRVRADSRGVLYRELAALLVAGMPLVVAIDTLIKTPEMKQMAGILGMVRDRVREGSSLSDALAVSKIGVTTFEKATIDVAERTASLDSVLVQLADFIDEHQRMKERIQQAMIYPALVMGMGLCVSVIMLGFLVPRTKKIMSGTSAKMPMLTKIMLTIGNGMWPWGILGIVLMAFACWFTLRHIRQDKNLRIKFNRKLFFLPLIGTGYRLLVSIRFAQTLSILVKSGVSLVEGVVLAGRSTGSPWVEDMAEREAESLRHGEKLSAAVRQIEPLAELLSGWIEVGETAGSLAEMLGHAAKRCQAYFDRYLARALVLLEPAMLLFIGGFVLLIVLSVMLPMFSISSAIAH